MSYVRDELRAEKIDKLKKEIENLRVSRRILMYLVEKLEKERQTLEIANQRLQKNNFRYAQAIVNKNIEIVELQSKFGKNPTYNNESNTGVKEIRQ